MLHSHPTLVFKLFIPRRPILYFLPLPPHHRILLMAVLLCLLSSLPPNSIRVLQWNAGGLRAWSTELLHFLSSHPVDLICIQVSNLNSSFSFRIPGFSALRSDRTHSILSPDATHASGGVNIFIRQSLSFSELSTFSLSLRLISNLIIQGSTSLLTTPFCSHFLMCTPHLFTPLQQMTEPTPFLPPPEFSSFWGTSIAITYSGTQEVLPTPVGRKYSIGSSLLTSFSQ